MKIALLWHMHQPDYRDPLTGRILLPWTFLHAVKDYGEMLRIVGEHPGLKVTFNLVPVMLEQLQAYREGWQDDVWLELAARHPAELDEGDRTFLVKQFFSVDRSRHILPYRRYAELASLAEQGGDAAWHQFRDQDLLDLQVWFLLAWAGHYLRRTEPVVTLLRRGENFGQADKLALLNCYLAEVNAILQRYRDLEKQGKIEISVTPYAHPILPLLCDSTVASQAWPGTPLPESLFKHGEDASLQISFGQKWVDSQIGGGRRGCWPSEGSLSEEVATRLQEAGVAWAASDEELLFRSLAEGQRQRCNLYRPYSFSGLPLLFRDRELSDRIGFVYADWDPQRAAEDLLQRLREHAVEYPDGTLALILDGENCWERYQDNGYPFLSAFYAGLCAAPDLEPVSCLEAVTMTEPTALSRLAPGSWINGNFGIWIGHPEKNRAWDLLARARRDCLPEGLDFNPLLPPQKLPERLRHLLHAEGSDWFWWYGDDHTTAQADIFDRLFRHHLEALYLASGQVPPEDLKKAIKPPRGILRILEPCALFSPTIDGRESDFFEWLSAGRAQLKSAGAMHGHLAGFNALLYGYDRQNFYMRLDPEPELTDLDTPGTLLEIRCPGSKELSIAWQLTSGDYQVRSGGKILNQIVDLARGLTLEIAMPLTLLDLEPGDQLEVSFHLLRRELEIGRWPSDGHLRLPYQGSELETQQWYV